MSYPSKDDFEQTLQVAEFASLRAENRRQYEFKIFISYVTLLVLGIYKGDQIEVSNDEVFYGWCVLVLLFVMHCLYISWTFSLSVAMRNDSERRNFYLEKAQYISVSLLKKYGKPICRKMKSEYCQLPPNEYKIKRVPNVFRAFGHGDQIWINYAVAFQVVLPTIILSLLVHVLFKELCAVWHRTAVILIPVLPFLLIAIFTGCRKKGEKRNEGHKTA